MSASDSGYACRQWNSAWATCLAPNPERELPITSQAADLGIDDTDYLYCARAIAAPVRVSGPLVGKALDGDLPAEQLADVDTAVAADAKLACTHFVEAWNGIVVRLSDAKHFSGFVGTTRTWRALICAGPALRFLHERAGRSRQLRVRNVRGGRGRRPTRFPLRHREAPQECRPEVRRATDERPASREATDAAPRRVELVRSRGYQRLRDTRMRTRSPRRRRDRLRSGHTKRGRSMVCRVVYRAQPRGFQRFRWRLNSRRFLTGYPT